MSLLHPCPYCGSEQVSVEETDIGGFVAACPCCGMSGPEAPYKCIAAGIELARYWRGRR